MITWRLKSSASMMTSSNGNIFRVTDPLCREFTGHRWIPLTKASDAELWCFLWSAPLINGWVNNREAGGLRRHRSHYDVIVIQGTGIVLPKYSWFSTKRINVNRAYVYLYLNWSFIKQFARSLSLHDTTLNQLRPTSPVHVKVTRPGRFN